MFIDLDRTRHMVRLALLPSMLLVVASQPAMAQDEHRYPDLAEQGWDAAALFALIAKNEWCPAGSVTIDLWTGNYILLPRIQRPGCSSPDGSRHAQNGTLPDDDLARLRANYRQAVSAGLEKHPKDDEIIVSNGGRELLAVSGPNFNMVTPEAAHDWSLEARALHSLLFEIFGAAQAASSFDDLTGRRAVAPRE